MNLSSKERMLLALSGREPDYIPLWCLWRRRGSVLDFTNTGPISDSIKRVQAALELGVDDTLLLEPPGPREDTIIDTNWPGIIGVDLVHHPAGTIDNESVIEKKYQTPDGLLQQSVRLTEDWPFDDELPFSSDFNVSRSLEYLVKGVDDLEKVKHVFGEPSRQAVARFREEADLAAKAAESLGVPLEGGWIGAVDMAVWLCGFENLLWKAIDEPEFVRDLLSIILECEKSRMGMLLDVGVDIITHSAWYEMPHMWSPEIFRSIIKPVISEETRLCHQGSAHFCYILTSGSSMIIDDLVEAGVDSIRGIDPVQGKEQNLREVKEKAAGRLALWGGINSAVTLHHGSEDEIRKAVVDSINILGTQGGFVLHPVDSIFSDTPWENVQTLISVWKEVRSSF